MQISGHQAQLLANKLTRHYKFRKITVLTNARSCGHAYWRYIDIPKITTVGLTIHEIAHIYNYDKYSHYRHDKKLHTTIKRFSNYFRKHLKEQFSTLELPKPKPKPTPLEKYQRKLKQTQKRIKRLTTKTKTLQTRLKTAKKKERYYTKKIKQLNTIK